eukprot:SAG31_NODE_1312_length_8861_cov_10.803127_4_plen_685_part_00
MFSGLSESMGQYLETGLEFGQAGMALYTILQQTPNQWSQGAKAAQRQFESSYAQAELLHSASLAQASEQHRTATELSEKQWKASLHQAAVHHERQYKLAVYQHVHNLSVEIRSSIRESLRDDLNNMMNKLAAVMTIDGLMLGSAFTVIGADYLPDPLIYATDEPNACSGDGRCNLELIAAASAVACVLLFLSLWASFVAMRRVAAFKIATKGGYDFSVQTELFERFAGGNGMKLFGFIDLEAMAQILGVLGIVAVFVSLGLVLYVKLLVSYNSRAAAEVCFWSMFVVLLVVPIELHEICQKWTRHGPYQSMLWHMSRKEQQRMKEVFHKMIDQANKTNKPTISPDGSEELELEDDVINSMLEDVVPDSWCCWVCARPCSGARRTVPDEEMQAKMREILDVNGDGKISESEFLSMARHLGKDRVVRRRLIAGNWLVKDQSSSKPKLKQRNPREQRIRSISMFLDLGLRPIIESWMRLRKRERSDDIERKREPSDDIESNVEQAGGAPQPATSALRPSSRTSSRVDRVERKKEINMHKRFDEEIPRENKNERNAYADAAFYGHKLEGWLREHKNEVVRKLERSEELDRLAQAQHDLCRSSLVLEAKTDAEKKWADAIDAADAAPLFSRKCSPCASWDGHDEQKRALTQTREERRRVLRVAQEVSCPQTRRHDHRTAPREPEPERNS